ncbi:uncharacterized protein [Chelonus insularis]|uniref:uncharacterized protein n=1 Tax=Chelonus insularis TaxID=460826 RepID=UPI00158B1B54|nr:uncharacterized protein LOC118065271 [Chelonus insularis]
MDDLKVYAASLERLRAALEVVSEYTSAIGIEFELDKCALVIDLAYDIYESSDPLLKFVNSFELLGRDAFLYRAAYQAAQNLCSAFDPSSPDGLRLLQLTRGQRKVDRKTTKQLKL